jgi:hypothetical protein
MAGYEKGKLYQIELSKLVPDPEQPRKFFDEQALACTNQSTGSRHYHERIG